MATVEHCLYCFETLVAYFERRKPLDLEEIQESYEEYSKELEAAALSDKTESLEKRIPALRRVADSNDSGSSASSPASGSSMSLSTETAATSTDSLPDSEPPITESPLFVTWNTVDPDSDDTSLRGCIGTFEAQELDDGLSSYAITSAIHDTRFNPMSQRELPSLEVAVTLLTNFEDCDDEMDWEIGTHGIRISFTDRGRRFGATYLPDVAAEQGWTKEETLVSLMRKANWGGRRDKWQSVNLNVVRYQGKKKSIRYPEYKRWRDWVDRKSEEEV
ncbi:AMMECR1 domain-containing protein [Annulohypoxylon maeteangense]|uniref:AMMECR1 domain-containing protein n=1 Tax=Annulohypoxylon maeteangense TaxID=1927788 RepID=UPI002008A331|nr:AMMECR1 domain-containing protein [Annulohypoxylon maeteangense]KAI0880513.1 AMMECR1 domain-containing protein [Annulohypoxylon maeteangense]